MIRTQVFLTAIQKNCLEALSKETGLSQNLLLREAIDQFIEGKKLAKKDRACAAGMWADRDDLPDLKSLRNELEGDK